MNSYQQTLANQVSCVGVALHTGAKVAMTLLPAPANTGIIFKRIDVKDRNNEIAALYDNVSCTKLGTTIRNADGVTVATVEHLMAALWGCGIDNVIVELDGSEVPIMDGSAEPFVFLIECIGFNRQNSPRKVIEILKTISIEDGGKWMAAEPSKNFSVSLEIDFNDKVISNQKCIFDSSAISFKSDLCRARTFGFEHEVEQLRELGLARGGSLENAVVVSGEKVINKEGLRYTDEFVRHKILDCIGDFYLSGARFQGHFHGYRSGHALNNKLLHKLFSDSSAWKFADNIITEESNKNFLTPFSVAGLGNSSLASHIHA